MLKNVYYSVSDWFMDSKIGLALITIATLAFVGAGLPLILDTVADQTASGYTYTGSATVSSHYIAGSFCKVVLERNDGVEETKVYGPKMSCYSVEDHSNVNLVNGRFEK